MFSFHKPRIYRSGSGCCICRAKSSSSRFTDSKRYEEDFENCFKLDEKRSGEICNACVLLVKRWKKLPCGSERNWQHVVDARAGHGSKLVSKIKKIKKSPPPEATEDDTEDQLSESTTDIPKKDYFVRESSPAEFDDTQYSDIVSNNISTTTRLVGNYESTLGLSPNGSGDDENGPSNEEHHLSGRIRKHPTRGRLKRLPRKHIATSCSFLDLDFWKREKTCCGVIFKGPCGEVLLDPQFLNPCNCRSGTTSPASISPQSDSSATSCFPSCENLESQNPAQNLTKTGGSLPIPPNPGNVGLIGNPGNDKILSTSNRLINPTD